MSIPKIIHYCWFGNPNKPKDVQKYINNWHEMLPDYKFMEWNEKNCDLENEIDYVKEAYKNKKYAFVADYVRVKRLYEYGGVYFDTDVEVIKRFDEYLIGNKVVLGFQDIGNLGTAFIAAEKENELLGDFLQQYACRHFVQDDGLMDLSSINTHLTDMLVEKGLDLSNLNFQILNDGIVIYPTEYFSAFDMTNWYSKITENTCTVHYMASSWTPYLTRLKAFGYKRLYRLLGENKYVRIRKWMERRR